MRAALLASLVAGLFACGGNPSRLDGSISTAATLDFDEVRAEWLVDRLSVRFLSGGGFSVQEPVRLTLPAKAAVEGTMLAIEKSVLVEHFSVAEVVAGQPVAEKPFPPVKEGVLTLTRVGKAPGEQVIGEFVITFTGLQHTLNGEFVATVTAPQ